MKSTALILLIFSSYQLMARDIVAKVVKVKGTATQLRPGAHLASQVSLGDGLTNETSLLTQAQSFVRIEFIDGSNLNLGPNSKVVIMKENVSQPTIIDLLKGKIRSKVQKDSVTSKHKFFIKTRTAAMGVRGTDFHSTFNPENNITNVITYNGEVAIAKFDEKEMYGHAELIEQNQVKEPLEGEYEVQKVSAVKSTDPVKNLDTFLDSNHSVVVKQGQYSGVSLKLNKATEAITINPVQYTALYKNKDLEEKTSQEMKVDNNSMIQKQNSLIKEAAQVTMAEQSAPSEGFYNAEKKEMAQKSGGFIDLESGLYIPPSDTTAANDKKQLFKNQAVGTFDAETGQYIPPKGLALDAKLGFVAAQTASPAEKEVLIAKANELNSTSQSALMITTPREADHLSQNVTMTSPKEIFLSREEQLKHDHFTFYMGKGNQEIDYNNSSSGVDERLRFSGNTLIGFEWRLASIQNVQPLFNFSFDRSRADVGDSNLAFQNLNSNSSTTFSLTLGYRYQLNSRWNFYNAIALNQNRFFVSTSIQSSEIRATLTKFIIGLEWAMIENKKFVTWLNFMPHYSFSKKAESLQIQSGFGFNVGLDLWYWLNPTWRLEADLSFTQEYQDVMHSTFTAKSHRNSAGLSLGIGHLF